MNVLITGASGFIGKNLDVVLNERGFTTVLINRQTSFFDLQKGIEDCDVVIHLAGSNRPESKDEFLSVNYEFTVKLVELIKHTGRNIPILFSSSSQVDQDNDYGRSKKKAEDYLLSYKKETGNDVFIFRLNNVFGKWCKPNYNSVVATFCHNIAQGLPIYVSDKNKTIDLVYIDDVIECLIDTVMSPGNEPFVSINCVYTISLTKLAEIIASFKGLRKSLFLPFINDSLVEKLYSTYLTYLNEDDFSYKVKSSVDDRGMFTELFKTTNNGQFSVNVVKPGVTKGNHYHHKKTEKFVVISGEGVINLRQIRTDKVIQIPVNGEDITIVDIIPGYTHNIINTGFVDLVFIIWSSEIYDPSKPDTVYKEV